MNNLPSKWLNFLNTKELKRLRADISNKEFDKFQIMLTAMLTILSVLLSTVFKNGNEYIGAIICSVIIVVILLLYIVPWIVRVIKKRKIRSVCVKGKDAVTIFDEEITYYLMTACEYSKINSSEYDSLQGAVDNFFNLEVEYYVDKALNALTQFANHYDAVFGEGKNKVSVKRLKNVVDIIYALIKKHNIKIDKEYEYPFQAIEKYVQKSRADEPR